MDKNFEMQKLARQAYEKGGFNGAWLYAEKGEIISKGALGWRDAECTKPVTDDSIFQLASVSKQFTATAVMLTIRKGLLSLDDEITKFFPELTAYKGVTIRHLLSHTGGVPDYFDDIDWFLNAYNNDHKIPRNDEIVRFLCETKLSPSFAPGEKLEYSNTAYNLLALIVERLSGVPYENFLLKNVFEPAGMDHTRACHIRRDGVPFDNYSQATVIENDRFVRDVNSTYAKEVASVDGLNGDDYVYTNVFDMLKWDRALREEKVLTLKEQELMYTPIKLNGGENAVYDEDEGSGYGFGWASVKNDEFGLIVSHSGGMPGVSTWFERYIDADRVLIMLFNRDPLDMRAGEGVWNAFRAVAADKEPDKIIGIEDIAINDPDKLKWESYCGRYEHPDDDFIIEEIFLKDGELFANAWNDDGKKLTFRLYPIGENKFGRKGGMLEITFGDDSITYIGKTYKKL